MVPFAVHTGWLKGWREMAQKLKGSRLKEALEPLGPPTLDPRLAENASSDDHSEWVM
jgi:hypothetical protein